MKSNLNSENDKPSFSVLIPDAEDWQTVKVLRCLGQVSTIRIYILSKKQRPLSRFSRYCSGFHHNTSQNDDDWIDVINKLIKQLNVNVILPVTLEGVELISKNRKFLSESAAIPALATPDIIDLAKDKLAFNEFIRERELPSLPTVYAGIAGESLQCRDLDSIEFPALLKPASGKGGFGIVKVENVLGLENAWHGKSIIKNRHYILQSYIPGIDICLQIFSNAGKISAYTVQKSLSGLNESYFGPQRVMEFIKDEKIIALGDSVVSAMQWEGIACIDFRVDSRDQKIRILELNPRFGQAMLGSLVAGVNFPYIACCNAMNIECSFKYRIAKYAHPSASAKLLFSRIFGRDKSHEHLKLSKSGLKFAYSDPIPETLDFTNRIMKRLKRKLSCKHLI